MIPILAVAPLLWPGYTGSMHHERVLAQGREIAAIDEVSLSLVPTNETGDELFTPAEIAYARSKSDPQRRLAARLAAKRAAARALGGTLPPQAFEVAPARGGPPRLILSEAALARLAEIGGDRVLLSLTHGRTHAAAAVVIVGNGPP